MLTNFNLTLSVFLQMVGFIIGLGAVTVIDIHGFLAQKSIYFTKATITAHKITKPLIWLGTFILIIGKLLYFYFGYLSVSFLLEFGLVVLMILNGLFLSFYVSPYLLKMEKNKLIKILPQTLQTKITISFIFSFLSWWFSVLIFAYNITVLN